MKTMPIVPEHIESLEDVVQLCEYAIEATGEANECDKGMCAGLRFVINCINGTNGEYSNYD